MATVVDQEIAGALRNVLRAYAGRLDVVRDSASEYYLQTKSKSYKNQPLMFGAVRVGKAYVSFHFFPLYNCPELQASVLPALRKRMQGKTCFNFKTVPEPALLDELRALTEAGFRRFEAEQLL